MGNNKKKSPTVQQTEHNVENNIIDTPKVTLTPKTEYTVEMVAPNKVWLRKDKNTVKMLVGRFEYKVGDIVKI